MYRRLIAVLSPLFVVLLVAACDSPTTSPAASAPLRYRDQTFSDVTVTSDVVYGTAVDQAGNTVVLTLDLYQPTGDSSDARPAVVWVHGGGFERGDKAYPLLVDEATTFAQKGYVTASINYRLLPGGCSPGSANRGAPACAEERNEAREDAQTAVRFLRETAAQYRIDVDRIAIGGDSAGAVTALSVGYNRENPGPGDHQGYSSAVRAVQSLSGAAIAPDTDAIGPGDAPALLFNAEDDPVVPYAQAQKTVQLATGRGLEAQLISWATGGHVPYDEYQTEIIDDTTDFFYRTMDLANATQ